MYNLHEFSERTDSELIATEPIEPKIDTNDSPTVDLFNSAGNTKLEDEEPTAKEQPTGGERPAGKIVLGKLISGEATVKIVNIFIPSFIVWSLHRLGYGSSKAQLKLTGEEKEILSPIVQDCLNYIVINFDNPMYALAFVATMIYGAKIFDIVPELKKLKTDIDIPDDDDDEDEEMPYKAKPKEAEPTIRREYIEVRKKIESTSIRKERNRLIVDAIETAAPADLIEMWKIYGSIFPERNENYFRSWYEKNYELFPDNLRFNSGNEVTLS